MMKKLLKYVCQNTFLLYGYLIPKSTLVFTVGSSTSPMSLCQWAIYTGSDASPVILSNNMNIRGIHLNTWVEYWLKIQKKSATAWGASRTRMNTTAWSFTPDSSSRKWSTSGVRLEPEMMQPSIQEIADARCFSKWNVVFFLFVQSKQNKNDSTSRDVGAVINVTFVGAIDVQHIVQCNWYSEIARQLL